MSAALKIEAVWWARRFAPLLILRLLSIVIAGLDPVIHAENLLAQSLRAASYAGCHHGPPGQARG
jgi:hypothetical protein